MTRIARLCPTTSESTPTDYLTSFSGSYPVTHNLSQIWKMRNSRNVTFLGGNDLTNSDKGSGGVTKILCQGFSFSEGIHVRNSNLTVVESITITYCGIALAFDKVVNATVRNVIITNSFASLQVSACQHFTLTNLLSNTAMLVYFY